MTNYYQKTIPCHPKSSSGSNQKEKEIFDFLNLNLQPKIGQILNQVQDDIFQFIITCHYRAILKCFLLLVLLFVASPAFAGFATIDKEINNSPLKGSATISVSVRELSSGDVVYQHDAKKILHPASTMKAFSTPILIENIKTEELSTNFYKKDNDLFIELSFDPYLTTEELENALKQLQGNTINTVHTNANVLFDDKNFGDGWLADNNTSYYFPRYSAFAINRNLIKPQISTSGKVILNSDYPINIDTKISYNKRKHCVKVKKHYTEKGETLLIRGTAKRGFGLKIPVDAPDVLFKKELEKLFKKYNIVFGGDYVDDFKDFKSFEAGYLIASIKRQKSEILHRIIKRSDNFASEMLFLLAGAEKGGYPASTQKGLNALYDFYDGLGLTTRGIEIYDASGASHNNLISADFQTLALSRLARRWDKFNRYKALFPKGGQDKTTLEDRFAGLNVWAKTGTISGVSAICGYITAQNGKQYAFSIIIQNYIGNSYRAKYLENRIIRAINRAY